MKNGVRKAVRPNYVDIVKKVHVQTLTNSTQVH